MSGTWHLDPERVADLASHLRVAVAELEGILATDPAARAAVGAVRAAADALRTSVIPAVDALVSTTAFTRAPECTVGDPVRGLPATRRPAPVTPAGRAGELAAIIGRNPDDATATVALGRLAALLGRHPALAELDALSGPPTWNLLLERAAGRHSGADAASATVAGLLASGAGRLDRIDAVAAAGAHSGDGVRLVANLSQHLDDAGLVDLVARLLARLPTPPNAGVHHPSLTASVHRLLDEIVDRPGALARLGASVDPLRQLVGDDGLDTDTVAAALIGVLSVVGPTAMLGHLMRADRRTVAAARVGSLTLAMVVDDLTPSLSSTLIVLPDGDVPSVVGDRQQLEALLLDIATDREATALLGVAIGALRTERIGRGLEAAVSGGIAGEQTVAATLAGQLAGVDRLVDLLADSTRDADAAAAAERSTLLAHTSDALVVLGAISSVVAPQVRPVLSLIGVVGGRLAEAAERTPHDGGDVDRLRMATEVEILAAVADTPGLHEPLGLAAVPGHLWDEVDDLVARHRTAHDDRSRAEAHARLMVVVADSVPLTTLLNTVGALADR
ncbi:MAG: hypothetical protein RIR49_1186 [Actinomycetota bacterium]